MLYRLYRLKCSVLIISQVTEEEKLFFQIASSLQGVIFYFQLFVVFLRSVSHMEVSIITKSVPGTVEEKKYK